jgi:outer membrane protein assembly factor BamE (lipoprotein component of BamABCDE complex)
MASVRNIKVGSFIAFIFFLVVTGCVTKEEGRLKRIQTNYPQWDEATVKKLAALQIEPGMTKEMVTAALGKPGLETVKEGETVWEYNGYRYSASAEGIVISYRYFVYFKDGKVTRTIGDPNKLGYR